MTINSTGMILCSQVVSWNGARDLRCRAKRLSEACQCKPIKVKRIRWFQGVFGGINSVNSKIILDITEFVADIEERPEPL